MTAIGLLAATTALKSLGPNIYELVSGGMTDAFSNLHRAELNAETTMTLVQDWGLLLVKAVVPFTAVLLVVGVAAGLLQSRFLFSTKPLVPDFNRINPGAGLSRMFSLRTVVEQVKSFGKLALIGYIAYGQIADLIPQIPGLIGQNLAVGLVTLASHAVSGLQSIGFGLLALGILDYGYQYWEFQKSMKMTKQEVKQEHKEQEGNPELKQKQRQRAREMARRRKALKEVPHADVVITNPTHFAVAIKYEAGTDAPKVVAKGVDLLAQQIKQLAAEHQVPTVENRPLARTLYASVEIGKTIPPELYQAVAEVLAFVYSLRRQKRQRSGS